MEPGSPWSHQVQGVHVHNHISGTVNGPVIQAGAVHGNTSVGYSEKRVIELQEKAVEQLSGNEPSVRLAGLLALCRLARANPSRKHAIRNIVRLASRGDTRAWPARTESQEQSLLGLIRACADLAPHAALSAPR